MIKLIFEDRKYEQDSIQYMSRMIKHILNCIYQPEIIHRSWILSINSSAEELKRIIEKTSYGKVRNYVESNIDKVWKFALAEFYKELNLGLAKDKTLPYSEKEFRKVIPNSYTTLQAQTKFGNFTIDLDFLFDYSKVLDFANKANQFRITQENSYKK